ncbi:hypothetical protein HMPREF1556_01373 [Porphyromonas sp. oral taxon 278 str. W7784]|nr:hypothetical protein HMPREF1556_01373 [Porphyromonas sp. oral taxon 278 str. W7784]
MGRLRASLDVSLHRFERVAQLIMPHSAVVFRPQLPEVLARICLVLAFRPAAKYI